MKLSKTLFAVVLACSFLSVSLGAVLIKFDGVDGESKDPIHTGWIDILAVSGLPVMRDSASRTTTGKHQHAPLKITRRIDKSSPLFKEDGKIGENTLHGSRMSLDQNGITYVLEGVKVLSSKKVRENEVLTLSYTKITTLPKKSRATDYNSSRSNKSENTGNANRATDYNSSRSNKNSSH